MTFYPSVCMSMSMYIFHMLCFSLLKMGTLMLELVQSILMCGSHKLGVEGSLNALFILCYSSMCFILYD